MEMDRKLPEMSYLDLLSEQYPTVEAASAALVRLRAFLQLPKGTEYYFSDLHGEHQAFIHLLRSASGTIRDKINAIHGASLPESELDELASLIYYPEQILRHHRPTGRDPAEWERVMLHRLLPVLQEVCRKYAHDHVEALISNKYHFVIRELMGSSEDPAKAVYYRELIAAAVDAGIGEGLISNICYQIQQVAVDNLHIIGDLFDRGPGAHKILDELMFHHNVDIQWGNHDIDWIGAAAGNPVCLFSVLRIAISYNNFDMLEDGYGINLRPLSMFAGEVYAGDPCRAFQPHILDENKYDPVDPALAAKMHKAVAVILFKLEGQLIQRNPSFGMEHRLLLDKLDLEKGVLRLGEEEYPLTDTHFPTLDPADPYALTEGEQALVDGIRTSFRHSAALKRHMDFLMTNGSMYKAINGNLLYHGCIPMEADGSFSALELDGKTVRGKAMLDALDGIVRRAYYQHEPACVDLMWYLWSGAKSPLFGKERMTTFERYFTAKDIPGAAALRSEPKDPYYTLFEKESTVRAILEDFGLDPETSHIINGHVPVKKGESPIKCGGRLFVIDGGISKAYQSTTGIAGYTLIFNSHSLTLAEHRPFRPATGSSVAQTNTRTRVVEIMPHRVLMAETDKGKALQSRITDLEALLRCYRDGLIRERKPGADAAFAARSFSGTEFLRETGAGSAG